MKQIIAQFELHTRLFKNTTEGFSEANAGKRQGEATHVKWLVGHCTSSRFTMAKMLGLTEAEPFPALYENRKGIQADATYPTMAELTKDWDAISEKIVGAMKKMDDNYWNAPEAFEHPMSDGTMGGVFAFIAQHEAYTIGQISILRRTFGMPAMKY